MNALQSKFAKQLEQLAYAHSIRDVFTDLIDLILMPMIIADHGKFRRDPRSNYSKAEQQQFVELMLTFGELADDGGTGMYDALGDLFMEHLSFGRNGQFFTPQPICDLMAEMQDAPQDGQTVCDCACGSGRTLLAMAKLNRNLMFCGSDIDLLCVKMATVNLALNSLRGEVAHMNTLSMDHWGSFHIHRCPFTKVPYIVTTGPGSTAFIERIQKTAAAPEPPIIINQLAAAKLNQGSLF